MNGRGQRGDRKYHKPSHLLHSAPRLFRINHPVLLAPMGDTAGGLLTAEVPAAGGLGLIAGGYGDIHWLTAQLAEAGDARVGVGFITFALDQRPDSLRLALDARPVAIQLSLSVIPDRMQTRSMGVARC